MSAIVEPLPTFEPPPGFWPETWPLATVSLVAVITTGFSPASWIFCTASERAISITSGTATGLLLFSWSWIFV